MIGSFHHYPALVSAEPRLPDEDVWRARLAQSRDPLSLALILSLVPLLDGVHTQEDIVGTLLVAGFELEQILVAETWLNDSGWIEESRISPLGVFSEDERIQLKSQIQALAALGNALYKGVSSYPAAGVAAQSALKNARIAIDKQSDRPGILGDQIRQMLLLAGVGTVIHTTLTTPHDAPFHDSVFDLVIYAPDAFDSAYCDDLNRHCVERSIRLLPCRQRLFEIEVGPLVMEGSACFTCYTLRRNAVAPPEEADGDDDGFDPRLNFPVGADWITLEAIKIITGITEPTTRNFLWRANLLNGVADLHPVLKLPRCPVCGSHRVHPQRKLWQI